MKSFQLYLSIESKTPILYVNINFTGSLLLRFGVFPFFWALAPTNNVFSIVSWRSPAANNCRNKRPNGHILIDLTSKFHVESSSKLHRFWKANPRGNYDIDSTWKCRFDFQNWQNIDEFSTWIFRRCFNVEST